MQICKLIITKLVVTMATGVSTPATELVVGIESARSALKDRVSELRTLVEQIESTLSAELDTLEKEQTQKQSEYRIKLSSLTAIRTGIEEQFATGEFEDLKSSLLSETNRKIETAQRENKSYRVDIVWEEGICDKLKGIGRVTLSEIRKEHTTVKLDNYQVEEPSIPKVEKELAAVPPQLVIPELKDYSSRCRPVATFGVPELKCEYPQGIAYDNIDHAVYILDNTSCRLYSYSIDSKTVREAPFVGFTCTNNKEVNIESTDHMILCTEKIYPKLDRKPKAFDEPISMYYNKSYYSILQPCGIEFHNNKFYVSAVSRTNHTFDVITRLSLKNDHCRKCISWSGYFGKHGSEEGEMNAPRGLAFSDPNLYVCDSNNHRINVYFNQSIVRTFTHRDLYHPLDIKICKDRIFVLNSRSPYIIEFDYIGNLKDEFLSTDMVSGFCPSFFCIDALGRFLISDKRYPCVYVFRRDRNMKRALETRLELEHGEESLVEPRGVCIDREGRVFVVCNYKQAMLQIF